VAQHANSELAGADGCEGKFSWASAPEGPLLFSINKSNYFNMRINLAAKQRGTILTMRKMSAAVGTVVDAETKQPIPELRSSKDTAIRPANRFAGTAIAATSSKAAMGVIRCGWKIITMAKARS